MKLVRLYKQKLVLKLYTTLRPYINELVTEHILYRHHIYGDESKTNLSENSTLNNALLNTSSGTITVGDDVILGHNVCLLTGTHPLHVTGNERKESINHGNDILIEAGAWLASNVTVIGPSTIGENSVIAAGSVVRGNVEANCLYAGVPAKYIYHLNTGGAHEK